MSRARGASFTVCAEAGCPELAPPGQTYCTEHERPPWRPREDNPRYQLSGWERSRRRKRVLARHHGICHICGLPGATRADHVIPLAHGGPDTEANMRPAHEDCHDRKTQEEAHAS